MGEAKRRGTREERVKLALENPSTSNATKAMAARIKMQEHINKFHAQRAQMLKTMGPIDKLYVEQKQMINNVVANMERPKPNVVSTKPVVLEGEVVTASNDLDDVLIGLDTAVPESDQITKADDGHHES